MNKKGFLLLEVIISIVVITAGLLYIAGSYSTSKNSMQKSQELLKTSLLLENTMWKFEEKNEIEEGTQTGTFLDYESYSWEMTASGIEGSGLNLIILKVFKHEDYEGTHYSLSTYLKNKPKE